MEIKLFQHISTASKTNRGQSDNKGYNMEVIYSSSDQYYELKDAYVMWTAAWLLATSGPCIWNTRSLV